MSRHAHSNYLGVYFGEIVSPSEAKPGKVAEFRFPADYEEAMESHVLTLVIGKEGSQTPDIVEFPLPGASVEQHEFAVKFAETVKFYAKLEHIVYSPNYNSVFAVFLNLASMISPFTSPDWQIRGVDVNEMLRSPAFLTLEMRRKFGLNVISKMTGWSDIHKFEQSHPAWPEKRLQLLSKLTSSLHIKNPSPCHRV